MRRIGYAETHPRTTGTFVGWADRYGIYRVNNDGTLYVKYEGRHKDGVFYGLPLGGRNQWEWDPAPFTAERDGFAVVRIFDTEGK